MTTQETSNRFDCPSCSGKVKVPPSQMGDRFQCPRCGATISLEGELPTEQTDSDSANDLLFAPPVPSAPESVTRQEPNEHESTSETPPHNDQPDSRDTNEDGDFKLSDAAERPNMSNLLSEIDPEPTSVQPQFSSRAAETRQPITQAKVKVDPFAAHAQELVAKAEAKLDEQERERPTLPENPFRTGSLSFLFQGAAIIRWCALSVAVNLVATLMTSWLYPTSDSAAARIGGIFLFLILFMFSVAFLLATSICCLAIVQDTANGFNKIENWPGTNFMDWIGETFYVINALVVSLFPGCLLAQFLFWGKASFWVFGVFGGISLALLFPPTLLSMITSSSLFAVVSPTIWRSLRTQKQTWKTFYLIAVGLMVTSLIAIWVMMISKWLALSLFASALLIALVMIYFRLLGRLAWVIEERIADEAE